MGCRIGITTDLATRKAHWELVYRGMQNWQVLAGPLSKAQAQAEETRLAGQYGCEAHAGGDDPDVPGLSWYVYGFNHNGRK